MPEPDNGSTLSQSGSAADDQYANKPPDESAAPCKKKTWVGIELVDEEGKPVPGEPYRLQLPDGRILEGTLDAQGTAGADGIDPGECKVCFPRLDGQIWRPL
jgi:type VI secretion system secreted protein VgrG